MRWLRAWWGRCWGEYLESYALDEEVGDNHPAACVAVLLVFLTAVLMLWLFEPTFRVQDGVGVLALGGAGCVASLTAWIAWRLRARTAAYLLQLVDSPLLGGAMLWAALTTPRTISVIFLFFWVLMAQRWAMQYALHVLSATSILLPAGVAILIDPCPDTVIILAGGATFFVIMAHHTQVKRQLFYGRARVSAVLRSLEALCERKVIEYNQFSTAMRRLREMSFILRANAFCLMRSLSGSGRCEECHAVEDIQDTSAQMKGLMEALLQPIDDGQGAIFIVGDLLDALVARRSLAVTLQGATPGRFVISAAADLRRCEVRGDLGVVALGVHNLVDNAWEAGALHVGVDVALVSGRVRVTVTDNGPGVPVALRRRLFEAGATWGARRAGMGLFFARQAMRFYGGDVRLGATGASGSTFVLELPVLDNTHTCAIKRLDVG